MKKNYRSFSPTEFCPAFEESECVAIAFHRCGSQSQIAQPVLFQVMGSYYVFNRFIRLLIPFSDSISFGGSSGATTAAIKSIST
jgi:hypothetical protein